MLAFLSWSCPCLLIFSLFYFRSYSHRKSQKYFSGPPAEPLLGHLRVFPQNFPWVTLAAWAKQYGDIMYLSISGKSIIVLNKAEDAQNLLEKRGSNYSDRPRSVLQGEIGGIEYFTGFTRYGDEFRTLKRYTTQFFNSREHTSLYPLLEDQVKILLKNLLDSPEKFEAHVDRKVLSAGSLVKATYGYEILSNDDSYIQLAARAFAAVNELGTFGLTPIDIFPILQYMPSWLPGMDLLQRARKARSLIDRMVGEPYERVKSQRNSGIEGSSLVDSLLEDYERVGDTDKKREFLIKTAAGQIYAAGAETSADTLQTFIYMMIHHPDVVKKAQAEIDRVIGSEQLPTLEDRPNLPYVDCVLREVMRINPAGPLGIPHVSLEEDVYKGKTIPAGTIIIPNVWSMDRDERYFPDPEHFNPDRFFASVIASKDDKIHRLNIFKVNDPACLLFGFGRRICPGRFLADANAWLVMANLLSVFDFLPAIDPVTGTETMPTFEWVGGMSSRLKPFHARIVPRSEKYAQFIRQETESR